MNVRNVAMRSTGVEAPMTCAPRQGTMVKRYSVQRPFQRFVGVDLGGARGKTTVVAHLSTRGDGMVWVDDVATRHRNDAGESWRASGIGPWRDDTLADHLASLGADTVIAIDAPLTAPACGRCVLPVCPGVEACVDPAVVWLRTEGHALVLEEGEAEAELIGPGARVVTRSLPARPRARLLPYAHRATEVVACFDREILPATVLGSAVGPIAARAAHLVKRLSSSGLRLNERVLEVSPSATVASLLGRRLARGYKRDADPWETRALILESLSDLSFAPQSRLAREDTLRNDHCFDAILSAYTAFLWARDGWQVPESHQAIAADGWIWAPPER